MINDGLFRGAQVIGTSALFGDIDGEAISLTPHNVTVKLRSGEVINVMRGLLRLKHAQETPREALERKLGDVVGADKVAAVMALVEEYEQ